MPRKVRDKQLDTREARSELPARGKPYWRSIEQGLHVGYRRLAGRSGSWWARLYLGHQAYKTDGLGAADDLSDADGEAILSFWQAQKAARALMVNRAHTAAGKSAPLTVAQACENYLDYLDTNKKSGRDARIRYEAFIKEPLGAIEITKLTSDQIAAWHVALAKKPPRLRTKKGETQKHREADKDAEESAAAVPPPTGR